MPTTLSPSLPAYLEPLGHGVHTIDTGFSRDRFDAAYLLVHDKLPNKAELAAYKRKLRGLRGIPAAVQDVLECIPASTHPMDVMRTACSALGAVLLVFSPGRYVAWRDRLHRRGRLRCDWIALLR
mgnify:CR=1 FL=1